MNQINPGKEIRQRYEILLQGKRDISSRFQNNKRSPKDKNTKANGEEEQLLTSQQVMAGSSKVMTHKERQAYLKNSKLGELLGVSHLFD